MKKSLILGFLFSLFVVYQGYSQDKKERLSPPKTATAQVDGSEVTIDYSSPGVKGRTIIGDLVPYGKVWRTGANEATTLTLGKGYMINGSEVPAGKYGLFTIPGEEEWTIIINSVWDQWGAYNYDSSKDVLRFNVKTEKTKELVERMMFEISPKGKVTLMWENTKVSFKID